MFTENGELEVPTEPVEATRTTLAPETVAPDPVARVEALLARTEYVERAEFELLMVGQQARKVLGLMTVTVPVAAVVTKTVPVGAVAEKLLTAVGKTTAVPAVPIDPAVESSTSVEKPEKLLNVDEVMLVGAIKTSAPEF